MPTKVGIHGFAASAKASRGWRAFARHDDGRPPESRDFQLLDARQAGEGCPRLPDALGCLLSMRVS
jgi:hypothetical protein